MGEVVRLMRAEKDVLKAWLSLAISFIDSAGLALIADEGASNQLSCEQASGPTTTTFLDVHWMLSLNSC